MIQFKQYPSIGNAADPLWMMRVRANVQIGTIFAVQEKVHGANVSFLCDDLNIRMARRTAMLDPLEPFFGYQEVLERYSGHIYHIYNLLRLDRPGAQYQRDVRMRISPAEEFAVHSNRSHSRVR